MDWEVVVVDNASTDSTDSTARRLWSSAPAPLRIVEERRPGLSRARRAGVLAASHDIVTLVDDDNWLAPDWLTIAVEAIRSNPLAGAVGGRSEAVFETAPPAWFHGFASSCAIGRQADARGDITSSRGYLWGAGLVVRREAWLELLAAGFSNLLDDRTRTKSSSGGDTEICLGLRLRGWRLLYDSRLRFRHFVANERLNWRYFRNLYRNFGRASIVLDTYLLALRELESGAEDPGAFEWRARLRQLLKAHLYAPRDFVKELVAGTEGSMETLSADYGLARILTLIRLRGQLPTLSRRIRSLARRRDSP